jgi:hypothetical protein
MPELWMDEGWEWRFRLRDVLSAHFGHKGATLQHSGWVDAQAGFAPFPAD